MSLTIPVELYQLSWFAEKLGCEDPLRYLEEFSWVDVDRLRAVGEQVWGASGQRSAAQVTLEESADRLRELLLTSIQDRWEGEAYTRLDAYMATVEQAIDDEAARLQVTGSALVAVADAFEIRWYEVVGYALAVLGLILGIAGIVIAVLTGVTGVGAVIGLIVGVIGVILAAVGIIVALIASLLPRLEALHESTEAIAPGVTAPTRVDELAGDDIPGAFPGDYTTWIPRTPSPSS